MRQLLTESLLLSLLGGITGLAILFGLKDFLLRFVPDNLPRLNEISVNWTVLLFAFCASVFSGVAFGLVPAFQAGRLDLHQAFKQEGHGSAGSAQRARTRRGLVITEFALSLILMIAAALLLRSFWDLINVRIGFNTSNVMTIRTRMPYPNDPSVDKYATAAQEAPFVRELTRRCASLPGVEKVALGDPAAIPLDTTQHELNVLEGHFYLALEGQNSDQEKPSVVSAARV
jgi:putative ABC transport system permease protein